jgi:hypothetical protein
MPELRSEAEVGQLTTMPTWLHAEYRDFHDYPRAMVCTNARGTFLFLSRFDEAKHDYADHYEVYRIRPLPEGEACASWFGIETRALARLPDLPVHEFPFDVSARKFLPYDPIAALLASGTST